MKKSVPKTIIHPISGVLHNQKGGRKKDTALFNYSRENSSKHRTDNACYNTSDNKPLVML